MRRHRQRNQNHRKRYVWFKHRAWIAVAGVLSLANVVAIWFAAEPGEAWHATTHALLPLLLGRGAHHRARGHRSTLGAEMMPGQEWEARLARLEPQQVTQTLET